MPSIGELSAAPRKDLHVFYLLDTSGSIEGEKIDQLNRAMDECSSALKTVAKSNGDAKLKIAVMTFSTGCEWMTSHGPEEMEDFEYEYINSPCGVTDVGSALNELNDKLSRKKFLKSITGALMPVIIFMTDGQATDNYEKALANIRQNKWWTRATKIGFALGEDADVKMIASVVGNKEAVIQTNDLEVFKKLIRFVSVTSSMLSSQSSTSADSISGERIVDMAKKELEMSDDITPDISDNSYDAEPEPEENDAWGDANDW